MFWLALSGAFALRFAERAFLASLFQEPPRSARSVTLFALLAIGTVHGIHYRRSGKHEWMNTATPPLAAPANAWRNDGGAVVCWGSQAHPNLRAPKCRANR
jgi:hypothetical protein